MNRKTIIVSLVLAAILILPIFSSVFTISGSTGKQNALPSHDFITERRDAPPQFDTNNYATPSEAMSSWEGSSSGLPVTEYGNRTDTFSANQMTYNSTSQATTNTSVEIPLGNGWEGYNVFLSVNDLTENRTWVQDPDMETSPSSWTLTDVSGDASWLEGGHGTDDNCTQFSYTGDPNEGKIAYASQTMTVPRGDVVWAGLRLDYWIDSSWSGGDGFVAIYVTVETGNYNQRVWQKSFNDVDTARAWFDSGLIEIDDLTPFDLSDGVYIEVGLYSQQTVNYDPNLDPEARVDNVELYLKTLAAPSNVNLKAEDNDVNNYTIGGTTQYGLGNLSYTPSSTWTSSPVSIEFSWTPDPLPPSPDRQIRVDFSVTTNLYARANNMTVLTQSPTAYGETYSVTNASAVNYETWFFAEIPDGYDNRYDFNITLPQNRDVYYVGSPLLTTQSLSEWNEGEWWARIPAYDHDDRWGYWLIRSDAPNMVQNLLMHHEGTGEVAQQIDLRANDKSSFVTVHDSQFSGLPVNITVFDPSGSKWYSEIAVINSTGHAATSVLTFGTNSSAGEWQVQAILNNSLAGSAWNKTGFFVRSFNIIHSSTATLLSPTDAISTWITNVTYPDLFLVRILVNDTDIPGVTVPGGVMTYNWTDGINQFGDNGDGEYIVTLDSTDLGAKGQYIIDIEWNHPNFDSISETLTVNLNLDGSIIIISPDSPSQDGPIGDNLTFRIRFEDYFGSGIDDGQLTTNWSNPYYIAEVSGSPGTFDVAFDTTGMELDDYVVNLTATADFILPQSRLLYVTVRELYTRATYLQNVLDIPVGEARSFTVEWLDVDHDEPMTGMNNSIVSNWSLNHVQGDMNYTVEEVSPGSYNVTIYTVDNDALATYPVRFDLTGYQIQNQTFVIDVIVKQHKTVFLLDEPVQQTDHGNDIIILVFFEDTDLDVGISNDTGDLLITLATPELSSITFSVTDSLLGTGHYNISIDSTQWSTIGWKNLTISIDSLSGKYESKEINTRVRLIGRQTDLYLENAPVAVNYLQNFSFSIVYLDAVNSSQISNFSENVILMVTALGEENPAVQSDFVVWESVTEPGLYYFTLNSSRLQGLGTFSFEIFFGWRSATAPLYENQTLTVNLLTLSRPTYLDTNPVPSTAYGETTTLQFQFIDSLTTMVIENSTSLQVSINEVTVGYTIAYSAASQTFFVTIDSASLGGVGDFTLHLNVTWTGTPYYDSIQNKEFLVMVTLRPTQLTHDPFTPGQYANNITIDFQYTDRLSGSSDGMTGNLSLNISDSYYDVEYLGQGHYRVTLNTSFNGTVGQFTINASISYSGGNYEADALDIFTLTVSERNTQLGYESPDETAYLENFTILVSYTDDSTGEGISGASIIVTSDPLTLVFNTDYWVSETSPGEYTILLNSSSLGAPADYSLNVTASKSGAPFYANVVKSMNARVIERPTQILITKTPGSVAFLENMTIRFKFEDFLTSELIDIDQSYIILSHGESEILIPYNSFLLTQFSDYYEIEFNSTLLDDSALVSGHTVRIFINRSSILPYYSARSKTVLATTIERPTQIQFPLIQDTPLGDNITIELSYIDYLSDEGIEGAELAVSSTNLTSFVNYTIELGDGLYRLLIPSGQFGQTGKLHFEVTFTKDGIPFYASRTARNIPATIRNILTSISYETPPAGVIPIGDPFRVNVTYTDTDHEVGIEGATISSDWADLYGRSYTVVEFSGGRYQVVLNTTGLIAQEYGFTITATLQYYEESQVSPSIQPGAPTVQINLQKSTYYSDWGQMKMVSFTVTDSYYGTLLSGMTATISFNDTLYNCIDAGNGTYYVNLDTSQVSYGVYSPLITVSRQYYQTRQREFTLVIYRATGQILPESSSIQIVRETESSLWIYLNDTTNNEPVADATVYMVWNNTIVSLSGNGTTGFYEGPLNVSGFSISTYDLQIYASAENHQFLSISVDVIVTPIPTSILVQEGTTSLSVTYGDVLGIYVEYNDTYYGGYLDGANISLVLGGYTASMEQLPDGRYYGEINSSLFSAQTLYLRVIARKDGYAQASRTQPFNILAIPTETAANVLTNDAYRGDTVNYTIYLNDTHTNAPIVGANVDIEWTGGTGTAYDLENGSYVISIFVNNSIPRLYDVTISVTKLNYQSSSITVGLLVKPTDAFIDAISQIDIPVNDTATVIVNLVNEFTNEVVGGVNALAIWETLGSTELIPLENGSYSFSVPGDLPIGQYRVALTFSTNLYRVPSHEILLNVRQVYTDLIYARTQIDAYPGAPVTIRITYLDTDHDTGITGVVPTVSVTEGEIRYYPDRLTDYDNGTYELYFEILQAYTMYIDVQFAKKDYQTQSVEFTVFSDLTPAQQAQQNAIVGGGTSLMIIAVLVVLYVKVWSIPKIVRKMNKMIKALSKGKIPDPADVPSRQATVLSAVNEEIKSVSIKKTAAEVAEIPIDIRAPEVNELLARLVEITGLSDEEIQAFRRDLSRMKASERPGFLKEVIEQEEARRADELAEKEVPSEAASEESLEQRPEDMEDLRSKLLKKGLPKDEIDLILEEAKGLSKADILALLESLGLDWD
ncbi:hypothetical protein EU537_11540 [Candidatus Thorarchaeota archaeon]|nr:MAG: hypothetical protein EU537_11540 [Candidatus Thorarchaeota archaeon]